MESLANWPAYVRVCARGYPPHVITYKFLVLCDRLRRAAAKSIFSVAA
jgi:hypothetical protein